MTIRAWAFLLMLAFSLGGCAPRQDAGTIRQYDLHETSLRSGESFDNPFWDPVVQARFVSPSGKTVEVDGFYYGGDEWRVRFVPRELGRWTFDATLKGKRRTVQQSGTFLCEGTTRDGFLRLSKRNRYRLEYDSGRPFVGVGIQTCGAIENVDFDGVDNTTWKTTSVEEWSKAFNGAVTLVRVNLTAGSKSGCAVPLVPDPSRPDRYNLEVAAKLDRMYALHRANGMSEIGILFQDMSTYSKTLETFGMARDTRDYKNLQAANLALQEKYIRYVVNRFGCYIDIWELFNEDSYAPNDYLAHLFKIVRDADPYDHIITTNFERPERDFCEIVCPHEYMNIPSNDVDVQIVKQLAALKSYGKPVQYTEFGNKAKLSNVDPIKWRVAAWTAFMNESGMLYWGMSGKKTVTNPNNVANSNAYIGPEERQQFRVMLDFTRDLPIDLRPRFSMDSPEFQFRSYALSNDAVSVVYLHRRAGVGYDGMTKSQPFRVRTGPGRFRVQWMTPEDGKAVGEPSEVTTLEQFLGVNVPEFKVDLACRIDRLEGPAPAPPEPLVGPKGRPGEIPAGWKVAWTADLNNPASLNDWLTVGGYSVIQDGVLAIHAGEARDGEITLAKPTFPGSVRLEFVAYLTGRTAGDLTTLLGVNAGGVDTGYAIQFGGKERTATRVLRAGKLLGEDMKETRLEVGRAYRIVAERDGNTIRLFVDGEKVIERVDDKPLAGRDLNRIGFYTYGGTLCVKELRALVKTSP